jgi:hypothetical protein
MRYVRTAFLVITLGVPLKALAKEPESTVGSEEKGRRQYQGRERRETEVWRTIARMVGIGKKRKNAQHLSS